jgi:hypothetical protein
MCRHRMAGTKPTTEELLTDILGYLKDMDRRK